MGQGQPRRSSETRATSTGFDSPNTEPSDVEIPCLAVLSGTRCGQVVPLRAGRTILGRTESHVEFDDDGVSRRHAVVELTNDLLATISDLDSTNGTFVNGTRIRKAAIREGDRINLSSSVTLRYTHRLREEMTAVRARVDPSPPPADALPLSKRELEVALLAARSLTSEQIAAHLHVSVSTVKTHLRNVYQRLEVRSRVQLTHYLLEHGILPRIDGG